MDREDLGRHLHELLEVERFRDGQPNGLHVEGRAEIERVVTGVSACQALFDAAVDAGADTIITHHGLLWGSGPRPVVGMHRRRLATLIEHDLNLFSYHLPLDAHPELGNNALACRALGIGDLSPFGEVEGVAIGWAGRFDRPTDRPALVAKLGETFGQEPLVFPHGPKVATTAAVVSGAGQGFMDAAIDAGIDVLITGEVREQTLHLAREGRVTFAACGHHATERAGVMALAEHLRREFQVEADYLDMPNPV